MKRIPLMQWTTNAYTDLILNARVLTARAIRKGRITKPTICKHCGKTPPIKQLHAHHNNYKKWWQVIWLCSFCHKAVHHTGVYRYCRLCNKKFYVPHWRSIDKARGKFCSTKCGLIGRSINDLGKRVQERW